jgi:hypothetical protein
MPQVGNKKFAYNASGIRQAMKALKNKKGLAGSITRLQGQKPAGPGFKPGRGHRPLGPNRPKIPGMRLPGRKPRPIKGTPFPNLPGGRPKVPGGMRPPGKPSPGGVKRPLPRPIKGTPFPEWGRPGPRPGGGRDFRPYHRPTRPMTPGNRVPKPPNRRYL